MNFVQALRFYLEAITINRIHSPYIYKMISSALDLRKTYYDDYQIEEQRSKLGRSSKVVSYEDLGAGSTAILNQKQKKVSVLLKHSTSNKWKCRLLRNLVLYFQPKSILELGTNLGMATAYLHSANKNCELVTVEGALEIAVEAKEVFNKMGYSNIESIVSSFDAFFDSGHSSITDSELVYMDGNHKYESTVQYFKAIWNAGTTTRVVIVDDINWSEEMQKAWSEIKALSGCHSIDFYKLGIIYKNESIPEVKHLKYIPRFMKPWQLGLWG